MKRLFVILLVVFLASGCSKGTYTSVSNADEEIFSSSKTKYTKGDLYSDLKLADYKDVLSNVIIKELATLEGADLNSYQKEAEDYIADLVEQGYDSFIEYYYGGQKAYIESYISYSALNFILGNEVKKDFDKFVNDYVPYKAEIVYFDTLEQANAAIEMAKSGDNTFAYSASQNGYAQEVYESVYLKDENIPTEVKDYVNSADKGISGVIETATVITDADGNVSSTPRFYVVNLISKDVNEFTDEFIATVSTKVDETAAVNNLIKKHNVKIHDQDIYEILSEKYEALK